MVINTQDLNPFIKALSSISQSSADDFVYLDPKEKKLFMSNQRVVASVDLTIEDVQEEDVAMILPCSTFFHVISRSPSIEINSDYSYKTNLCKGKFEHNNLLLEVISSIKETLSVDSFEELLIIDDKNLPLIKKASIFVDPDNNTFASRGVHIENNTISSSSKYRIYMNEIDTELDAILYADILKHILTLGTGCKISSSDSTYRLQYNNLTMVFVGLDNVDHFPLHADKFVDTLNTLKQSVKITLNLKEFLPQLDFISYFTKGTANNLTKIHVDNSTNLMYISVGENIAEVSLKEPVNEEVDFHFDCLTLKEVLTGIEKTDEVNLYYSSTSNLFIIEFSQFQNVILVKIKI